MDDNIGSFSVSGLFFNAEGSDAVNNWRQIGQELFPALFLKKPFLGLFIVNIPDVFLRLNKAVHNQGNI